MPSVTFWTRLEPYTRLDDVDAGLAARVHDPLWFLARQWQTGEFTGEDGGTPVQVRARIRRSPLVRFRAGPDGADAPQPRPYGAGIPLEARVEAEGPYIGNDPRRDLRLAADAGLIFLRQLDRAGASAAARAAFLGEPVYQLPAAPNEADAGPDPAARAYLSVASGRLLDGIRVYLAFNASLAPPPGTEPGPPARPEIPAADRPAVTAAGQEFVAWFESRFVAPTGDATPASWVRERLEYAFAVAVAIGDAETGTGTGDLTLAAPEHHGGALDWYSFDADFNAALDEQPSGQRSQVLTRTVMPAPVRYPGIAADRWWQFEDGAVNLARIDGDPDELLRLLLVEFALLYGNDWYVVPVDLTPDAAYDVRSLVVTDVFGERTLVPHHRDADSLAGRRGWNWLSLTPTSNLHLLPPVTAGTLCSDPIEDIRLVREEVSNLVWAVERLVPGIAGGAVDREAAYRAGPAPPPLDDVPEGALRYRLATTVPEHWIPFRPQRVDPADPADPRIVLRRAAALLDGGDAPELSRPQGRVLEPRRPDLTLFEEEVPAEGVRVVRRYQYARWTDGRTVLWLGRQKTPGRLDATSGLAFDLLDES